MDRVINKVFAYIVKESNYNYDQLLVLSHKHFLQIPWGTVKNAEAILDALKRVIYDETGIGSYEMINKLGEKIYSLPNLKKEVARHFFLVRVPRDIPDCWQHERLEKGRVIGENYECSWYEPQEVLLIPNQFHQFLSREFIPTLFPDEVMLGLNNQKVSLMPDTKLWREEFEREKIRIQSEITEEIKIEHIGSTAIPNIPAKPIIDIGIGINNSTNLADIIKSLEEIGYINKGENGIAGRSYFVKGLPEKRKYHLHMYKINHPNWKNHLLFRDYLINNADIAKEYGELKLENWRFHKEDRKKYTDSKDEFIKKVFKQL